MPTLEASLLPHSPARASHADALQGSRAERLSVAGVSASDARRLDDQRMFAEILAQHDRQPTTPEQRARKSAEDFVAQALVQPLLARLRESSQAGPPFGPGPGQRAFQGMIDASFAQKLVRNQRWDLVARIEQRLVERGGLRPSERAALDGPTGTPARVSLPSTPTNMP